MVEAFRPVTVTEVVPVATVAIGMDGTCLLMCEDGWREAMVGTLASCDAEGERQHTIYLAATPEYGRAKFLGHLEAEIDRARAKCPDAHYVGIADGASGNWEFLGRHTDVQVTDFWHAAEYLGKAAMVLALSRPELVERLVVADIAPVAYSSGSLVPFVDAMLDVDPSAYASRKEVEQALKRAVQDPGIRQFLLSNLTRGEDGFRWTLNLRAIRAAMAAPPRAAPLAGRPRNTQWTEPTTALWPSGASCAQPSFTGAGSRARRALRQFNSACCKSFPKKDTPRRQRSRRAWA